jgi:sigma-B regulation protein RsbU (phosphoserine phosphatase)
MKKKILVIDDEENIQKVHSRILMGAGYDVVIASNGKEALDKLEAVTVDLIMLDMKMPEMDGLHFLRKIRESDITHVPVLMVSGDDNPDNIVESYKLGVYDFIHKPEMNEVMLKRVENGLKIGEMINFNEFIRIELMMARRLQKYLFPEPDVNTGSVSLHTWSLPLSDIGGDLYDYVVFQDERLVFFVADVSGHSISAALYTAIVKMVFHNALQKSMAPGDILTVMNKDLAGYIPVESFVTAFCGMYDPHRRILEYANAGHPMPYWITGSTLGQLKEFDPFLGPIPDTSYRTHAFKVEDATGLFVFTDGVIDAMGRKEAAPAGSQNLLRMLNVDGMSSPEKFKQIQKDIIHSEVAAADDCTLMLVEMF